MNRFLRRLALGLAVALIGGCAHTGNLTQVPTPQAERLAQDAAAAMRVVLPPASTTLAVDDREDEPFLGALVAQLRKDGYAIEQAPPGAPGGPAALRYVVDRPDTNHYRVRIQVGERSLQRLYGTQGGALQPASAWTRQD